jgi:predicted unusual protein kinase regulating ubiquinone biosynthesis (AarF/ABC1/UbiB family)
VIPSARVVEQRCSQRFSVLLSAFLRRNMPTPVPGTPGGAAAAGAGAAASSGPSAEVQKFFADVKAAIKKHPSLVAEIAGIFCFVIKGAGAKGNDIAFCFTVDLKNQPGDVIQSLAPTKAADTTLEYKTAADFLAINAGKLDLKRAIFSGRLKIGGNVKALQRMHECMESAKKREQAEEVKRKQAEEEAMNRIRAPSYAVMPSALHQAALAAVDSHAPSAAPVSLLAPTASTGSSNSDRGSVRSEASAAPASSDGKSKSGGGEKRMSLGAQIRGAFTVSSSPASSSSAAVSTFSSPAGAAASVAGAGATAAGSLVAVGQPPQWQSDDAVHQCTRCQAPFGIVRRKHHCRNCGRIFCQACSSRNVQAPGSSSSSRRFCDFCMTRVYNVPPPDGLRIPDPAFSLANRLAMAAGGPSTSSLPIQQQQQLQQQAPAAGSSTGSTGSSSSPRFSIKGSSIGSNIKSLFSSGSGSSSSQQRKESRAGSSASVSDLSLQGPLPSGTPPRAGVTGATEGDAASAVVLVGGSIAASSDSYFQRQQQQAHYLHQQQQPQHRPSSAGTEVVSLVPASSALGPPPSGDGSSSSLLLGSGSALTTAAAPIVPALTTTSAVVPGITRETVEEVVSDSTQDLQSKIDELEKRLVAMQAQLAQAETVPELVTSNHTFETVLGRIELVSTLLMPLLYALSLLGWKVVPAVLAYYATSALFSGRWFWFLLYAAACGWIIHKGTSKDPTSELFRRRMRVYSMAVVVFFDYRLTRFAVSQAGYTDSDPESEAIWDAAHRRNAMRLFRVIRDLRGLWVKAGQFLSSRPDIMPAPFVKILSALQDSMPARPLKDVKEAIEAELKRPISEVFASLEEKALAAASVGQVHRGKLKDGTTVAVKVQHKGMDVIISQDLSNLSSILSWLSYVEIGFDLKGVMEEWLKEVLSELQFTLEAKNMTSVRENLQRTNISVTIPRVIPGLVGKGVLVMRFIEGVKVSDKSGLDKLVGENKDVLVSRICRSFAHQIYRDGRFSCDPHPGNIFVARLPDLIKGDPGDETGEHQRLVRIARERKYRRALKAAGDATNGTRSVQQSPPTKAQLEDLTDLSDLDDEWVPTLIDFGLCKTLPENLKLAFGKLVVAAEEIDIGSMLDAMGAMGMLFSTEAAGQDLENLQAMFSNAVPASEAKKDQEEKERLKREKEEKEKAEKAAAAAADPAAANAAASRKVTAWPPELMMFLRTSQILTGVASFLETRHPFMHTMAAAARMAMLDDHYNKVPQLLLASVASMSTVPSTPHAYFRQHRLPAVLPALPGLTSSLDADQVTRGLQQLLKGGMSLHQSNKSSASAAAGGDTSLQTKAATLERRLRKRLAKLHQAGAFVGCQLVVVKGKGGGKKEPEVLVSVSAGTCGHLDPRPVTPATLFPALGASRVGVAAATAHLASSLSLDLDRACVGEYWPSFAVGGDGSKAACSIGELLRCRSGIESVCPSNLSTNSLTRAQWNEGSEAVAKAKPLLLPRIAAAMHGKPLPSSAPANASGGGSGWGGMLSGGSSSSSSSTDGASSSDGGAGSNTDNRDDEELDLMSPVSSNDSDDDDDDDESERGEGSDADGVDNEGDENATASLTDDDAALDNGASTTASAKKTSNKKQPALPSLAEDGGKGAEGEDDDKSTAVTGDDKSSKAAGDAVVAVKKPKAGTTGKKSSSSALVPAKPAFTEVPARLVDCFHNGSATTSTPCVGPDVETEQASHLFFGYGWAVGEMLAGMAARLNKHAADTPASALTSLMSSVVERAAGLKGHATFGLPEEASAAQTSGAAADSGASKTAAATPLVAAGGITSEAKDRIATLCLGGSGALDGVVLSDSETDDGSGGDAVDGKTNEHKRDEDDDDEDHLADGDAPNENTMSNAMAAMELAESMVKGGLGDLTGLMQKGREHFIDPRLVNMSKVKSLALLPSMNLYASALGLACLLDYACSTHIDGLNKAVLAGNDGASRQWREALATSAELAFTCEDPSANAPWINVAKAASNGGAASAALALRRRQQRDGASNKSGAKARLLDLRALWAAHYTGLRLIGIRKKPADKKSKGAVAKHTVVSAVGCGSLGGSATVVMDVASGVTVAITTNRITSDRALPRAMIRMVFEELGLGTPSSSDL